ncbi:MAG: lytic transglycosylase domain-containing protein [Nitrospirae bacterium]|nr:lytic transglycosylase domain-containing protein [Nitrospirota bacterium]
MVVFCKMLILRTVIVVLLLWTFAEADIYKYVREDGVILYTDAPLGEKIIKEKINKKETSPAAKTETVNSKKNKDSYHPIVHKKAKEHDIDPSLVTAVIKAESNGNPYAVSRKGAMGLMQLMPMTASELQVRNPFDPEDNIDGGTRYLRYLIERFNGNLTLALAAYNAGPKVVEKYGSVPPISETRQYVKRVLSLYNGKTDIPVSASYKQKKSEPIYKIIMEDGTILFTNFPLRKTNVIRF